MADNTNAGVPEELKNTLDAVCDMVTLADLDAMQKSGKGYHMLTQYCAVNGNALAQYDLYLKYKEDPDGTKHIIAETANKVVADVVFDREIKKAMAQAAAGALLVYAGTPVDGADQIAGAVVYLGMALRGYVVAKTKSWFAGKGIEEGILKLWPDKNVEKAAYEGNIEVYKYSVETNLTKIQDNAEVIKNLVPAILKTDTNKLQIGTRVLDIRNLSEIELRNAVSHIDSVSFLLSEINIRVGEKLDMGSFGIYTVKGGDTLSEIAASHGMVTKELVMLNTWLVDDGRIDFLYPTKVLVDAGTIVNSVINHTIAGSMQDDVIIDHNGGTDTLIGNGGADYMDGGQGYDTYYSGNGDTIKDTDNNGRVLFEGFKLTGGVSETGCKPNGDGEYRGDGGVYKLSSGKLTFTKDGTNETLIIEKFVNGALGIILTSKNPGASCPPPIPNPGPSTPSPNFPSPLVLDLNGDGVTSTFISSTSTYFDLDNDGVRQRTGWVQSDDALLVFDKNQDGIINNASELFGNHTTLKNGTNAANGFEALKEYDENKDGLIDAKDNIYNTLSLWQDSNSDGVTDTGELHTLKELGVSSINLGYTQTTDYEEQNRLFQTSSFTTTDGTTQNINDVWFATESRDTARDTTVTLKDSVAALPDFRGAGRAGNLSVAMNEIKIEREVA